MTFPSIDTYSLFIIGLGYVGLPLACEFGKVRTVIGFDINVQRIHELSTHFDSTHEVTATDFSLAKGLSFSCSIEDLSSSRPAIYIITVPTPVDIYNNPDLQYIHSATSTVAKYIKPGDLIIYESTVYPGCTEEFCVPILEKYSQLQFNSDFFCGYSPERINPGDSTYKLPHIVKVTSGSTPEAADLIDELYKQIITAGTFKATSIQVAEAAKVIENTQRDLNIALINELSIIFSRLGIDTSAVLEAASTKWNFLPFKPGLVGGHCIGVDPYYLTYKAQSIGYNPEIILAGRRLNDSMPHHAANLLVKSMLAKNIDLCASNVLVLGVTFKENCPDLRNSKVIDFCRELRDYNINLEIFDPHAQPSLALNQYSIDLLTTLDSNKSYEAIVFAVAHDAFKDFTPEYINSFRSSKCVVFDMKSILPYNFSDLRL